MRRVVSWTIVLAVALLLLAAPLLAQQPGQPITQIAPGGLPSIVQKASNSSSGSVASLAKAFTNANTPGNSIVVVFANGNSNNAASPCTDSLSNPYSKVVQVANGSAFESVICLAVNIAAGANTVTVTPGGTSASIAMEIYELPGLITSSATAATESTTSNTSGAATTSPSVTLSPDVPNEYIFVAYGLGTAAQTITVASPYANDSGQLNPATPSGLFSFVSSSFLLSTIASSSPSATVGTGEPWAVAAAAFKPVILQMEGSLNVAQLNGTTTDTNSGNKSPGTMRVVLATDQPTMTNAQPVTATASGNFAVGETNSTGTNQAHIGCDSSVVYDASTSGSTQLVALSSGKIVYVCGFVLFSGGTVNVKFVYGTGTACATGSTNLTPAFQLIAQTGASFGNGEGVIFKTAASNALCINASAGIAVQALVVYAQF